MIKHLSDIEEFIKNPENLENLRQTVSYQFNQLNKLGLLEHTRTENRSFEVKKDQPEVIILLASYPLQSQRLRELFEKEKTELEYFAHKASFALRFHCRHSAGYGLFCNNMVSFGQF